VELAEGDIKPDKEPIDGGDSGTTVQATVKVGRGPAAQDSHRMRQSSLQCPISHFATARTARSGARTFVVIMLLAGRRYRRCISRFQRDFVCHGEFRTALAANFAINHDKVVVDLVTQHNKKVVEKSVS
jgi:hypothetical protein